MTPSLENPSRTCFGWTPPRFKWFQLQRLEDFQASLRSFPLPELPSWSSLMVPDRWRWKTFKMCSFQNSDFQKLFALLSSPLGVDDKFHSKRLRQFLVLCPIFPLTLTFPASLRQCLRRLELQWPGCTSTWDILHDKNCQGSWHTKETFLTRSMKLFANFDVQPVRDCSLHNNLVHQLLQAFMQGSSVMNSRWTFSTAEP